MMQEMYIENNKVDLSAGISSLLTFAIDDVADFASRSTAYSKTIVLPGTGRNNRIFGNIFDIGQGNLYDPLLPNYGYNYNASKSASCIIFQDNIQTFKGVIRLTQINKQGGYVEYETVVFGELFLLNAQISGKLLEDLNFSEYDHTLSVSAITDSWDNTPGSGYYYPLIDHGGYSENKHDWDYRTFRPALYAKEYIDKMFANAGFRYESDIFNTDRFKRHIIPYNKKTLTRIAAASSELSSATDPSRLSSAPDNLTWATITGSGFTYNTDRTVFTYAGSETVNIDLVLAVEGEFTIHGTNSGTLKAFKNGVLVASQSTSSFSFFSTSLFYQTSINPGDTLNYQFTSANSFVINGGSANVTTSAGDVASVPINIGDNVPMNEMIPRNIRQVDFLSSIVKLYNLYIYEDKYDKNLLHIEPFVDFFDVTGAIDWTYKLNRGKVMKIKPMSELTAKIYRYNYKDDSDYYNDLYNKRYGQSYGSYMYDSEFDFATQENKLELIFAPTVLVGYQSEDKIYSTIFKRTGDNEPIEEHVDSVIRILQSKKVTGVVSWNIKDEDSVLGSYTSYGYAGHLDDPDAPTNDLNFGALEELFFTLVSGTLSNNQFNLYWSSYMAEITDKDSKLLTASFRLTTKDIYNLDFAKYITVDGVLFRLNKITDYNMSEPKDCEVELIKVNYTVY